MRQLMIISVRTLLVFTVLTGVLYPSLVWVVGQTAFRDQVNGSLVRVHGDVVGSSLIGQEPYTLGYWENPLKETLLLNFTRLYYQGALESCAAPTPHVKIWSSSII